MEIRKLKEKDAERMLLWMYYDETKDIFEKDFSKYDLEDVLNFINSKDDKSYHYACADDDDNYLGTISLKNVDLNNSNAELAISFIKEAQGTGAATFAIKKVLNIAFNNLLLNKVYLNVLETNARAKAFYKKVGFTKEGCFKNHIKKNGRYVDLEWYAFFKDDFNI